MGVVGRQPHDGEPKFGHGLHDVAELPEFDRPGDVAIRVSRNGSFNSGEAAEANCEGPANFFSDFLGAMRKASHGLPAISFPIAS